MARLSSTLYSMMWRASPVFTVVHDANFVALILVSAAKVLTG